MLLGDIISFCSLFGFRQLSHRWTSLYHIGQVFIPPSMQQSAHFLSAIYQIQLFNIGRYNIYINNSSPKRRRKFGLDFTCWFRLICWYRVVVRDWNALYYTSPTVTMRQTPCSFRTILVWVAQSYLIQCSFQY